MKEIQDVMTKDPAVCLPGDSLETVARLMVQHDCGEIPVVNNQQDKMPVGVITDRDICCRSIAQGLNPLEMQVQDCMSSPAILAVVDMPLEECLNLMESNQIRRLPVVDKGDRCCGMVSQADIARSMNTTDVGELLKRLSDRAGASGEQVPRDVRH
jgi:CBS domain-containing protein